MALEIPVTKVLMPSEGRYKRLVGFDVGPDLYHVILFEFDGGDGAIGVQRNDDNFVARISLDSLALFNRQAAAMQLTTTETPQ